MVEWHQAVILSSNSKRLRHQMLLMLSGEA
jgi:hypothetical protein